jgi:hypothetical protein
VFSGKHPGWGSSPPPVTDARSLRDGQEPGGRGAVSPAPRHTAFRSTPPRRGPAVSLEWGMLPSKASQLDCSTRGHPSSGCRPGIAMHGPGGASRRWREDKENSGGGDSGRPSPRAGVRCGARSRAVPIGSPPASVPGRCAGSQHMRDRVWQSSPDSSRYGLLRAQIPRPSRHPRSALTRLMNGCHSPLGSSPYCFPSKGKCGHWREGIAMP